MGPKVLNTDNIQGVFAVRSTTPVLYGSQKKSPQRVRTLRCSGDLT